MIPAFAGRKKTVKRGRETEPAADQHLSQLKARAAQLYKLGKSEEELFQILELEYTRGFIRQHRSLLQSGALRKAKKKGQKTTPAAAPKRKKPKSQVEMPGTLDAYSTWVAPSEAELLLRETTLVRLRLALRKLDQFQSLEIVGSFAHGLSLPTSDLDVVVVFKPSECLTVSQVAKSLRKADLMSSHPVVLSKARVPLLKYRDRETQVSVDLSFETAGFEMVSMLQGLRPQLPQEFLPLLRLLKAWLWSANLNDPAIGGLGSLSAAILLISYLQHNPDRFKSLTLSLSSFFEFFGEQFNSNVLGISILHGGSFFVKASRGECFSSSVLAIEDPCDPHGNNVARATNQWRTIRRSFALAASRLRQGRFVEDQRKMSRLY